MGAVQSRKEGAAIEAQDSSFPWKQSPVHQISSNEETGIEEYRLSGPLYPMDEDPTTTTGNVGYYTLSNRLAASDEKAKAAKSKTSVAKKGAVKVYEVGSLVGRAGLGKAVEALDTLGSSMTNFNLGSGFASGATSRRSKIEILSFEVANTIVKGYNLKQSLSKESIKVLKEEILCSEGVQRLVSTDMSKLLSIAAADKRKELMVFAKEVVRFGNQCRDPQWHLLDRYFDKLGTEVIAPLQSDEEVEEEMQCLVAMAQQTADLYHELSSLERFESEVRRKLQDEDLYSNYSRGDNVSTLRGELKSRRKHLKTLKKRSLWSKTLEEVMEKLVDIVYFVHREIGNAFGDAVCEDDNVQRKGDCETLGSLGLALHYACIINQIDGLVLQPGSVPVDARENLYQSLPTRIKGDLRHKILEFKIKKELSLTHIKAEMEKMLAWLVPIAVNTTKAHHGFGWVGEWANTGSIIDKRLPGQTPIILVQTLHHADRRVTDDYLLELVVLLHFLVYLARDTVLLINKPPTYSHRQEKAVFEREENMMSEMQHTPMHQLSPEDQDMLQHMSDGDVRLGISRSQNFDQSRSRNDALLQNLTKSNSFPAMPSDDHLAGLNNAHLASVIDFGKDKVKALDLIDRVDDV